MGGADIARMRRRHAAGPAALVDLLNSIARSRQALAYQQQPTVRRLLSDDHVQVSSRRRQSRRSLVPEPAQLEEGDQNPRLMHGAIQTPISPEQSLLVQPELGADLFLAQPGCTRLTASFGSRPYLTGHARCRANNHPIAREPLSGPTQQRPRWSGWNRQPPPHQ